MTNQAERIVMETLRRIEDDREFRAMWRKTRETWTGSAEFQAEIQARIDEAPKRAGEWLDSHLPYMMMESAESNCYYWTRIVVADRNRPYSVTLSYYKALVEKALQMGLHAELKEVIVLPPICLTNLHVWISWEHLISTRIRALDREYNGITPAQEAEAERAISARVVEGRLTVVRLAHLRPAAVTDRLLGQSDQLLILCDDRRNTSVSFCGDDALCTNLKKKFNGLSLGKAGAHVFWEGCAPHEAVLAFVREQLTV